MELLQAFSRSVLKLYQAVDQVEPDCFRKWALILLREYIEFDSAIWIQGVVVEGIPITHSVYLDNLSEDMLQEYANWASEDYLFEAVLCNPGRCFLMSDVMDVEARRDTPMYQQFASKYGIEQVAGAMVPFGASGIHSFLSLYRNRMDQPFSEGDRAWFQASCIHMVEAETQARLRHARRQHGIAAADGAVAVVSKKGHLKFSEIGFLRHLDAGWPDWKAPCVPDAIMRTTDQLPSTGQIVCGYVVKSMPESDGVVVSIRPVRPLDLLTARERQIAMMIADGLPYKKAASGLGISASTVTNHVNSIYEKLNVKSAAGLRKVICDS